MREEPFHEDLYGPIVVRDSGSGTWRGYEGAIMGGGWREEIRVPDWCRVV